jgi:sugar phosphate isomerase/epimerase
MSFLRNLALASAALALSLSSLPARAELVIPDEYKTNGFAVGCQAYSFNRYSVMEAIEKTAEVGGKVIEFFPGQRLRKDQPAVAFSHKSPDEVLEQVKAQLKKYNILPVAYGVVGPAGKTLDDRKAEWRQIFEFGKKMNLRTITSEPKAEDMDFIETLVKEFDICLAIHDHPKQEKNPNYKFWDPNYVLSLVKDRDKRMGACADTGHWVRSGIKPVDALKILEGRVISSHLKDLNEFGVHNAHDVVWGTGVSDVKGILDELKRQGFKGHISAEYEYHWETSVPEIKESIAYVKDKYGK